MGIRLKKYVFVACACIMFLNVTLTGCELFDSKESWVKVVVETSARAFYYSLKPNVDPETTLGDPYDQRKVQIATFTATFEISVAGTIRDIYQSTTGVLGMDTDRVVSFPLKVWKDQDVVVTAYIAKIDGKKVDIPYYWRYFSGETRTITWAEIWERAGEEFETQVHFDIGVLVLKFPA